MRPNKYSQTLAAEICRLIADGLSLRTICAADGMPASSTVYLWLREKAEFSEQYAHARAIQADALADEIIELADQCEPETAAVAKAKVQIDARKWKAARLAPKKYGDKVEVDNVSTDGSMRPQPVLTGEEIKAAIVSGMQKI